MAVVLDLYSRKIVGFALSDSPDSELTEQALSNAFNARGKPIGVMFHSDQGCHRSVNAPMELFFRSLKTENMPKNGYENETMANDSVRDYIYRYYNLIIFSHRHSQLFVRFSNYFHIDTHNYSYVFQTALYLR